MRVKTNTESEIKMAAKILIKSTSRVRLRYLLNVLLIVTFLATETQSIPHFLTISSSNVVDVYDDFNQLVNSTQLPNLANAYPYAIDFDGQQNIRLVAQTAAGSDLSINVLSPSTLDVTKSVTLRHSEGVVNSAQNVLLSENDVFIFIKSLDTIFRFKAASETLDKVVQVNRGQVTSMAFDSCDQALYWSTPSTVSRINLSTKEVAMVLQNLSGVRSLHFDQFDRQLYWTGAAESATSTSVEKFDPATKIRQKICSTKQRLAIWKLSTDKEQIFLLDWKTLSIQTIRKSLPTGNDVICQPEMLIRGSNVKPMDVAFYNINEGNDLCSRRPSSAPNDHLELKSTEDVVLSSSKAQANESTKPSHGPCHNYCLQPPGITAGPAVCSISAMGIPVCHCPTGFEGLRCELDICRNFCLNGGRCFVDDLGQPGCNCSGRFGGDRCALAATDDDVITIQMTNHRLNASRETSHEEQGCNYFYSFVITVSALIIVILSAIAALVCIGRRKRGPPASIEVDVKPEPEKICPTRNRDSAKKVTCSSGAVLDMEDCCQMTLCEQPCAKAIFRKPEHLKSRSKQSCNNKSFVDDESNALIKCCSQETNS